MSIMPLVIAIVIGYSYSYRVAHMSIMPLVIAIVIEWHT